MRGLAGACASAGAIKSDPNTEGAPDLCETAGNSAPLSASPNDPPQAAMPATGNREFDCEKKQRTGKYNKKGKREMRASRNNSGERVQRQ